MNRNTFTQGFFSSLVSDKEMNFSETSIKTLHKSLIQESVQKPKTTVFISHKHDDLADNKEVIGIIGLLERNYGVIAYIDGNDSFMPKNTSGETAKKLKERIKSNDKFMLLLSENALKSPWCNWELGYGDSLKFPDNIAIFPINTTNDDSKYSGNEYLQIYPHVVYRDGTTRYRNSDSYISRGFYVRTKEENSDGYSILRLEDWLKQR